MISIPTDLRAGFMAALSERSIPPHHRRFFLIWLQQYLQFCDDSDLVAADDDNIGAFVRHLSEQHREPFQQKQAAEAVGIYLALLQSRPLQAQATPWDTTLTDLKKRILTLQYSKKTLATYNGWVSRFREYVSERDPAAVTAEDAAAFFTHLATDRKVAASTQNQAFNALLFLFKHVLKKEFEGFEGVVRAKRSNYVPVVLSRREVDAVIAELEHPQNLLVKTMYGCGLRLFEAVNLRICCLNFDDEILTVHDGKGRKDRAVPLPAALKEDLRKQLQRVRSQLEKDLENGFAGAFMPEAMARKFRAAATNLPWQWLFPARRLTYVPDERRTRRYHAHETRVSGAIRQASAQAGLTKRVTAHSFRHSYASHLLQNNYDIRTIQQLLGHSDVKTTMIYTHTVKTRTLKERKSPLDFEQQD